MSYSPGNNTANYNSCADWNLQDGNVTTVGTNGGPSAYGTFDQTGNVWEWNEAVIGSSRGLRGGDWYLNAFSLSSSLRSAFDPSGEGSFIGFRLATSLNPLNLSYFVSVGDSGNNNDSTGYGSVGYNYAIAQYPVTNCEYVAFLNAIASSDTYGLYNISSDPRAGITRSGSSGSYTYTVKTNMGNKPVNYVSWFDCARYCNWLHNGKPIGNQNSSTTEDGAYTLNGAISGNAVSRNSGANYHIPTENEWYKAAYYKGGGTNAGYWAYATQSDSEPTCVTADVNGNGPGGTSYVCCGSSLLFLKMNNVGGNTFIDSSSSQTSISAVGNVSQSSGPDGTLSGFFDGGYLYTTNSSLSDLIGDIQNQNFEIETWFYLTSYNAVSILFSAGTTTFSSLEISIYNKKPMAHIYHNLATFPLFDETMPDIPLNTWHKISFKKDNLLWSLYFNNVLVESINLDMGTIINNNTIFIGAANYDGTIDNKFNGYIYNFQIKACTTPALASNPTPTPTRTPTNTPTNTQTRTSTPTPTPTLDNRYNCGNCDNNLIQNGDFEQGTPGSFGGGGTATYWAQNSIDVHSLSYDESLSPPQPLKRWIDLHTCSPGYIQQTINTVVGQSYVISFKLSANNISGRDVVKTCRLSIIGTSILSQDYTFDPSFTTYGTYESMGWVDITGVPFTATSSSTTIKFESTCLSCGCTGPAIDCVCVMSITPTPTPTPTPTATHTQKPTRTPTKTPTSTPAQAIPCDKRPIKINIPKEWCETESDLSKISFRIGGPDCCGQSEIVDFICPTRTPTNTTTPTPTNTTTPTPSLSGNTNCKVVLGNQHSIHPNHNNPLDTGIDLNIGEQLNITATGLIDIGWGRGPWGPDGITSEEGIDSGTGFTYMALLGKIGSGPLFKVGSSYSNIVTSSGRLYLFFYDTPLADNIGSFTACITVIPTPTITSTPTVTPTITPTNTRASTPTPTPTNTVTPTQTARLPHPICGEPDCYSCFSSNWQELGWPTDGNTSVIGQTSGAIYNTVYQLINPYRIIKGEGTTHNGIDFIEGESVIITTPPGDFDISGTYIVYRYIKADISYDQRDAIYLRCPAANSANFNLCADWNLLDGNVTTVGSNGGPSAYGTYDQSGNVYEWNDLNNTTNSFRGLRGGFWGSGDILNLSSSDRYEYDPVNGYSDIGFRISSLLNPLSLSNFVLVGDLNNVADTTTYGSVSYNYQIAQYLVTNCEYAEFLNAIASSDTYGLYDTIMDSDASGGITRSGSSGSYSYSVKTNMGNKPVIHVSWFDCARYCNWLHNGKPVGNQNSSSTEDGAYTLNGVTSGNAVSRNSGANYHIPTENEWYKAAYYKGAGTNAGYWTYATQSDSGPTCVTADINGNGPISSNYNCTNVSITPTPTQTSGLTPTPTPTNTVTPTPSSTINNLKTMFIAWVPE